MQKTAGFVCLFLKTWPRFLHGSTIPFLFWWWLRCSISAFSSWVGVMCYFRSPLTWGRGCVLFFLFVLVSECCFHSTCVSQWWTAVKHCQTRLNTSLQKRATWCPLLILFLKDWREALHNSELAVPFSSTTTSMTSHESPVFHCWWITFSLPSFHTEKFTHALYLIPSHHKKPIISAWDRNPMHASKASYVPLGVNGVNMLLFTKMLVTVYFQFAVTLTVPLWNWNIFKLLQSVIL